MATTSTRSSDHTPGPWRAENIGAGTEAWGVVARGGRVVVMHDFISRNNARLVAAAPELLDACKAVAAWLSSFSMPPTSTIEEKQEHLALLELVIAKAEGR